MYFRKKARRAKKRCLANSRMNLSLSITNVDSELQSRRVALTVAPRVSVSSVGNVSGIDQCMVVNSDSSAVFETIADDELLAMLEAVGQPSVLGEIDGKVRVISDAAPVRAEVDTL